MGTQAHHLGAQGFGGVGWFGFVLMVVLVAVLVTKASRFLRSGAQGCWRVVGCLLMNRRLALVLEGLTEADVGRRPVALDLGMRAGR